MVSNLIQASRILQLHALDSVIVALETLVPGQSFTAGEQLVTVKTVIPAGHKCAITAVSVNMPVYKYGVPVGAAIKPIAVGEHVHTHNMRTALTGVNEYAYTRRSFAAEPESADEGRTFMGYRRENGQVGTRNEIWVLSTVGCVSRLAQKIALRANEQYAGCCDGIYAFTHPFGCSQTGEDLDATRALISALAQHPNAGGVLVLGLGCENNQGRQLLQQIPAQHHSRIRFFNCQDSEDELGEGLTNIKQLLERVQKNKRQPCPLSDLVVGMKCGGSDGFSGLSANPLVGSIADRLCVAKGTVLLTETPEMFGAEQILMNRAANEAVFNKIVRLINQFKQYFIDHGQSIYENPSPGNREGGITTLEEKSMGAIQKGGDAPITDVLQYAEQVKSKGLNLLQAPGNDAVSSTALTASGANLILFTTGRGTPLGFPAPTLKISSNSSLASRKPNWVDFDAGRLFTGDSLPVLSDELLNHLIEVASGERATASERGDQREIAIWKNGVTL